MKKAINIFKTKAGYVLHIFVENPLDIGIIVWDDDKIAKNLKDVQRIVKDAFKEQYLGVERWEETDISSPELIITMYMMDDGKVSVCSHSSHDGDVIDDYLPTMKKHEVMFALEEILSRKGYKLYVK